MSSVNKKLFFGVLSTLLVVFPLGVYAQALGYITVVLSNLLLLTESVVPLLTALALLLFLWGVVVFIAKAGDEKGREEGKQKMLWGLIGLFVLVSVWGLVILLQKITQIDGGSNGLGPPGVPSL